MYHKPVLLVPSVSALVTSPQGIYVDVTFGGGGHSREILSRLAPEGRLLAFDQDPDAAKNVIQDSRFQFIPYNFEHLKKFLQFYKAYPVDGILADLGVSSHQFDTPERGFSHRFNDNLDMRMNRNKGISAAELLASYPPHQLTKILGEYGEVQQPQRIVNLIIKYREEKEIITTGDLVEAVKPALSHGKENKILSQIFQAIRIEVNHEIGVLKEFLSQTTEALKPGGILSIISYHSLEDRLVKNFMKTGNFEGELEKDFYGNPLTPFTTITRKAIIPNDEEIATNSRSRSAKLRIAQKK